MAHSEMDEDDVRDLERERDALRRENAELAAEIERLRRRVDDRVEQVRTVCRAVQRESNRTGIPSAALVGLQHAVAILDGRA